MKKFFIYLFLVTITLVGTLSCVAKKKRNETSKFGKFYHNTTAYYNGYWNSKEIIRESLKTLRFANTDDYTKILEVEDFISVSNPKMVKEDMDKILQKVSTVAQLHEPSEWVDDCYVMMGKAQYLKQEYETAEETLVYFQEDFNPSNPYGRNYKSKKPTGKAAKKAKKEEQKIKAEKRKEVTEEKEKVKKETAKTKEQERKEKAKEREKAKKEKEKQRKEDAKNRKKGIKTPKKTGAEPKEEVKSDVKSTPKADVAKVDDKNLKDEEPFTPIEPKKPQEDKTAYSEGMLWLAKVYIKRENFFSAQMLLERLHPDMLNDDAQSELAPTYANLYIKQERYAEAIPKLEEAIETAPNNRLKARYAFIAGQISQQLSQYDGALKYFAIANKYASHPKMEFMSELAVAKSGIITGKKSKDDVLKDLAKMANENKYIELKDQIYYTMGEIELSQNNSEKAISYFQLSANNNISDQKLKAEAYYKIASLHYEAQKYLPASNYYDSTLMNLQNTDPRHSQVKKYVDNLQDIASNIENINYQDSLLFFASLVDPEKKKAIMSYLERNIAKNNPVARPTNPNVSTKDIGSKADFGTSTFFAYNKATKEKGKESFNKTWGNITLEDDWRRSEKTTFSDNNNQADNTKKVSESDAVVEKVSKEEYEKFLREVPSNPVKIQEVNDKIVLSMFTLGKLFRDKIENFVKSAETLEKMHTRYGPTPYELDSYFYLYLDYMDMNNGTKMQEYKEKITKKYPESQYAAIISDPDYFKKSKSEESKADKYYKTVHAMFENGEHAKVVSAIDQAGTVIGADNPHEAKMTLLKAMSKGNLEGKDAYVKGLNEVITSYPNTPEQLKAKEILRFLGGDNTAFANVMDVDKIYSREEATIHYVAVITYNLDETDHINFKVAISEYTKKYHKEDRLQFGDAALNIENNEQIILVRKFDNEAKAMEYYQKAIKNNEEFTGNVNRTFDIFPISQTNYRKMMTERSARGYRTFFENSILNK